MYLDLMLLERSWWQVQGKERGRHAAETDHQAHSSGSLESIMTVTLFPMFLF